MFYAFSSQLDWGKLSPKSFVDRWTIMFQNILLIIMTIYHSVVIHESLLDWGRRTASSKVLSVFGRKKCKFSKTKDF